MPRKTTKRNRGWDDDWQILIVCRKCEAQFESSHVDPSSDQILPNIRLVLVGVPDACPFCRSLRAVPAG